MIRDDVKMQEKKQRTNTQRFISPYSAFSSRLFAFSNKKNAVFLIFAILLFALFVGACLLPMTVTVAAQSNDITDLTQSQGQTPTQSVEQQVYDSNELVILQHIGGEINVTNADRLQQLVMTLHLLPIDDYRQTVLDQNFSMQPKYVAESLALFEWGKPVPYQADFSIDSLISTRNTYQQITKQVEYPIAAQDIPDEDLAYLRFTDLIDSDPQIAAKAKELAAESGGDDLFAVAFAAAQWVANNVQYNLTTITADATQNATWVYDNRRGVCDELSVLYISMMRSLGIPARFVSGVAYTNSPLFSYPWSPHAWVEVYFPNFGWVPFDLTYKQFGYIDAGHIALQTSVDANDSSTEYTWQGYGLDGVSVTPSDLSFTSSIVDARSQIEDFSMPSVRLLRDTISLTSSSAIVVSLQNSKNYYVSAQLSIGAPQELNFSNGKDIQLLLRPFEAKTIYIPVTVQSGLSDRYSYQFPIVVTNFFQVLANTTLFVASTNPTYGTAEINAMIANTQAASQSIISANVRPQCAVAGKAMVNASFTFTCDVENTADSPVSDFSVCVSGNCTSQSLAAQSTTSFNYTLLYSTVGVKQVPVRLEIGSHVQESLVDVTVSDLPSLAVTVLQAPAVLSFDQSADIKLLLEKTSFAAPQKTVARIFDKIPYIWNVGSLQANKELTVSVSGSSLRPGMNTVPITVTFADIDGKTYTYSSSLNIELINVSLWQRIVFWLEDLVS